MTLRNGELAKPANKKHWEQRSIYTLLGLSCLIPGCREGLIISQASQSCTLFPWFRHFFKKTRWGQAFQHVWRKQSYQPLHASVRTYFQMWETKLRLSERVWIDLSYSQVAFQFLLPGHRDRGATGPPKSHNAHPYLFHKEGRKNGMSSLSGWLPLGPTPDNCWVPFPGPSHSGIWGPGTTPQSQSPWWCREERERGWQVQIPGSGM